MTDRTPGIYWTALREGQDWVDDNVIAAIDWLSSLVPSAEWTHRLDAANSFLEAAKSDWARGKRTALYDPSDVMPWYIMQATNYAYPDRRPNFFEPDGYRIAPVIRRLGQLLPMLRQVGGVDERGAHLMSRGVNPDDVIYELLVAGTYRRRWPMVDFIPEEKGRQKRPDLFVTRGRSSWAIECKRTGRSGYARDERDTGQRMAKLVHELAMRTGRSLALLVTFNAELVELGDNHLLEKAAEFLERDDHLLWEDSASTGMVCDVSWRGLHQILRSDDIYFGGSRMIELLLGAFRHDVDYDVDGDWTPAEGRPLHATWVDRVSLVAWRSSSETASSKKAQHFKRVVARATDQLPGDRPGAVHVGYETLGGSSPDLRRHLLNKEVMRSFEPGDSRLRYVYGNYFMPEHTTHQNESCAVSETMAWYPIGRSGTREPLKGHMLFDDLDGTPGMHFQA